LAQPAATVLTSPWTDLTLSGETMTSLVGIDPVFTREKVSVRAADYVGSADPADPSISPIFADLPRCVADPDPGRIARDPALETRSGWPAAPRSTTSPSRPT
jgi:hypothetical protein